MLNKNESKIMSVLYAECKQKKSFLISPVDLIKMSGAELTITELDKVVGDLYVDGYFDLVYSDRRGEKVYCITLTEKGKGFLRDKKLIRRNIIFRLCLSVGFAIFSFVLGLILKAIFK